MPPAIPTPPLRPELPTRQSDDGDLFDYALARDYAVLLLTSPARHKKVFALVFVGVLVATLAILFALPKSYTVETQVLALRGSRVRSADDLPTRGAVEMIMSRLSMETLVRQTNLVEAYKATRSPATVLKDFVYKKLLRRKETDEDVRDGVLGTLEKKLWATVTNEGVVTIGVTWQTPELAYKLAAVAQQNYLAGKEASEVSDITETLAILGSHATSVRSEIDEELARMRANKAERAHAPVARARVPAAAAHRPTRKEAEEAKAKADEAAETPVVDPNRLDSQQAVLLAKRRDVQAMEEARAQRLDAVQKELTQLKSLYTSQHPLVQDAQQRLDALQFDSPQLAALKADVADLEKELGAESTVEPPLVQPSRGVSTKPFTLPRDISLSSTGDPEQDYESAQLRMLSLKYNNLLDRIDSAHLDLETTQAAFKQRFIVIRPAQFPTKPDNLKPPMVIGAGLGLGLLLALFVCAGIELVVGRIVRRWQIERLLGVPVLAQLRGP